MLSRSNVRYLNTLCRMREFELGIHGLHFAVLFLRYSTTFVQYYICFMHAYFDFDYRKVSKSPPRNPQSYQPAVPRKLKRKTAAHTRTHSDARTIKNENPSKFLDPSREGAALQRETSYFIREEHVR